MLVRQAKTRWLERVFAVLGWVFFGLVFGFCDGCFFMEQPLARSGCYRCLFVFEHFFYSSAEPILYSQNRPVNNDYA
jgi:hypothetical protein